MRILLLSLLVFSFVPTISVYAKPMKKRGRKQQKVDQNAFPHHFFNAELLNKNEKQISIVGNAKIGLNERWEVGTQGLFLLLGGYNLSLKHLMFERPNWKTAFSSHTFFFSSEGSDVDPETLEESTVTTDTLLSAFGVVTTHNVNPKTRVSWGLYDLYIGTTQSTDNLDAQGHFISPTAAIDYNLGNNWFFTGTLTYAAYVFFAIESDVGDASIDATLFDTSELGIDPVISFLTATYRQKSFNLELGLLRVPGTFLPYLNLFWRLP